jgi:hypothetical protein
MDRRFATIKGLGGPIILQRFNWLKLPLSVRRTSHRHGWLSYPSVPRFYTPNPLHNATPYSLPPRGDNSSGEVDWEYELIFENLSSCRFIRVLLKIPVFPCLIFFLSITCCLWYILAMDKEEYNSDDAQLAQMGHKSELKRNFSLMYVLQLKHIPGLC